MNLSAELQGLSHCGSELQSSSEVFYRKFRFWDGGGQDAPPVFNVQGVNYLHVKVNLLRSWDCVQFTKLCCSRAKHTLVGMLVQCSEHIRLCCPQMHAEPLASLAQCVACHAQWYSMLGGCVCIYKVQVWSEVIHCLHVDLHAFPGRDFTCMQDGGVILVATTRENVSPSLVLEFLRRVGGIIKVFASIVHHTLAHKS